MIVTDYQIGEFNSNIGTQSVSVTYHSVSASVFVEVTPFIGSGTEQDPYLIENKYQLDQIRNYIHSSFKLTTDIVFSAADFTYGGDYYNQGAGWIPIGKVAFYGNFDGSGHIIKNLTIDNTSTKTINGGLFSTNNGRISNLRIVDCNIKLMTTNSGYAIAGCVTAYNGQGATISNCFSSGKISGSSEAYFYAGGISAENTGTISQCYSDVDINISSTYYDRWSAYYPYAGGITAYNDAYQTDFNVCGLVENCYNTGTIIATASGYYADAYVGGLVAENRGVISTSYNMGCTSVILSGNEEKEYLGGIAGLSSGAIQNC